jgi:hypothetical protein
MGANYGRSLISSDAGAVTGAHFCFSLAEKRLSVAQIQARQARL